MGNLLATERVGNYMTPLTFCYLAIRSSYFFSYFSLLLFNSSRDFLNKVILLLQSILTSIFFFSMPVLCSACYVFSNHKDVFKNFSKMQSIYSIGYSKGKKFWTFEYGPGKELPIINPFFSYNA